MRTLELKDIAAYLPYELSCKLSHKGIFNLDLEYPDERSNGVFIIQDLMPNDNQIEIARKDIDYTIGYIECDEIMPILRPMSDLTKPIIHNGEEIIPLVELAKIASKYISDWIIEPYQDRAYYIRNKEVYFFYWDKRRMRFILSRKGYTPEEIYSKIYEIQDFLNELNFDYRGLIDLGLALDINTLDL